MLCLSGPIKATQTRAYNTVVLLQVAARLRPPSRPDAHVLSVMVANAVRSRTTITMYEFYCNDVVDTMGTTTSTASPTPLVTGLGVDEEIPGDLKAWAITAAEYRGHAIERKKSALKRGLITAGAVVGVGAVAVLTGGAALAAAGAALAAEGAVVGGVAITAEVAGVVAAEIAGAAAVIGAASKVGRHLVKRYESKDVKFPRVGNVGVCGDEVVFVSLGFLTQGQQFAPSWDPVVEHFTAAEIYGVEWESQNSGHLAEFISDIGLHTLAGNPWGKAVNRAEAAGVVLGEALLSPIFSKRPVTLIGHSLGKCPLASESLSDH